MNLEENATMERNTKRKVLVGIFALSCAAMLASCDPAKSLPLNYESPIVNKDGQKADLYDNKMGVIYDAISSNKNDKVLEELLYNIGVDQFGDWKEITRIANIADPATKSAEVKAFVSMENHKRTYSLENDTDLVKEGYTIDTIREMRFQNFYEDMLERINEVFYNEISSKSYNDEEQVYHELRLAIAHYGEMYNIDIDFTKTEAEGGWYVKYLTPDFKKEDVSSFIHLDRYTDYIERKIIPQIYKDKMVEEYLFANNYSTLGRAYGRKVNVLKITHDSKTIDIADKLFKDYVDNHILNVASGEESVDFEIVSEAWKGFKGLDADGYIIDLDSVSALLLEERPELHHYVDLVNDTEIEAGEVIQDDVKALVVEIGLDGFYRGTQLASIIEDYNKACRAEGDKFAKEADKTALNGFTNSGAQSKEKGLSNKLIELALKDYTSDGWYVKNSGMSDLPSELANRLFNINVSNALDNFSQEEMETKDKHDYATKGAKSYVRYINNHYFLTPAKSQSSVADGRNFVIHDADSNSFYLVEVVEAPSTAKLNVKGESGYFTKKANPLFSEEVARDIAKILGTKDSYVTDAQASYIKLYSITYQDSSVYEYFKSKYPELFEDDKK